jgi:hypothetical protein
VVPKVYDSSLVKLPENFSGHRPLSIKKLHDVSRDDSVFTQKERLHGNKGVTE